MADPLVGLDVEVTHNLQELVDRGVRAITAATAAMAEELRETHIPAEAPSGPSGNLADPANWSDREVDPLTRIVFPGDKAWYAHIVARGRREVRPKKARALTIGDEFAARAGGHSGNPFHERALAAAERSADRLIAAALSEEGL